MENGGIQLAFATLAALGLLALIVGAVAFANL
jgi:hypothetical protein